MIDALSQIAETEREERRAAVGRALPCEMRGKCSPDSDRVKCEALGRSDLCWCICHGRLAVEQLFAQQAAAFNFKLAEREQEKAALQTAVTQFATRGEQLLEMVRGAYEKCAEAAEDWFAANAYRRGSLTDAIRALPPIDPYAPVTRGEALVWMETRPTVPGWYWVRSFHRGKIVGESITEVSDSLTIGEGDENHEPFPVETVDAEWSGPIPEPTE